ncbi:MAG: hypothetical protein FJ265_18760, partial [Planctomycetes bacterium]|nr:hypothetical protein [Planctomycetota bacterium]
NRTVGRSFVYRAVASGDRTRKRLLSGLLDTVFDGAIDQLVASALAAKRPTAAEIGKLRALLAEAERARGQS